MMEDEVSYSSGLSSDRVLTTKKDIARSWMEQFTLVGVRESQLNELRYCMAQSRFNDLKVISVCGIPGIGKSELVRYFYYNRMLERRQFFHQYAWVNVSHPFNIRNFCRSLLSDLHLAMVVKNHIQLCRRFLKENRCFVVIDNLQSNQEWDLIKHALKPEDSRSVIIVITNEATIGKYCADSDELIINVTCLEPKAAIDLFEKVCFLTRNFPLL